MQVTAKMPLESFNGYFSFLVSLRSKADAGKQCWEKTVLLNYS